MFNKIYILVLSDMECYLCLRNESSYSPFTYSIRILFDSYEIF